MRSFRKFDLFRVWLLTLLYATMVLFGVLLVFTTISLWSFLQDIQSIAILLIATSVLTTATSLKSLQTFMRILRIEKGIPKLEIVPFFFMLISLIIASRLFANF